jgi:hypothetical protein
LSYKDKKVGVLNIKAILTKVRKDQGTINQKIILEMIKIIFQMTETNSLTMIIDKTSIMTTEKISIIEMIGKIIEIKTEIIMIEIIMIEIIMIEIIMIE